MSNGLDEKIALLSSTDAFGSFTYESLKLLASGSELKKFSRDHVVYEPGDEGRSMFVVVDGIVNSSLASADGRRLGLARMEQPTVFGHLAALDGQERDARVITTTSVTLLEIPREVVLDAVKQDPDGIDGLFRSLGRLVRRAGDIIENLAFLDARARLAARLLQLTSAGEIVRLDKGRRISQAELATFIGTTRQTVNELLNSLEADHCIERTDGVIQVVSAEALHKVVQGS
jgi:CRP/FNR family transcriptional regulator, cyclic AMP receptor protein